jgi:hypothetical protein
MVGSHPVVGATAGLDDGRGGARTPDGSGPGTGGRTNDSARPSSGADPPRQLRRSRSPPSRGAANHRLAAGVNHDASLFCSAPDSGLVVRHDGAVRWSCCGSAVRRTSASGDGPAGRSLRRSRFGRGRSSYRSRPACGSPRRGTAALTPHRHEMAERLVDLRHDCRDIGPACVPGTGVGHGAEPNRQVQISAPCLPSREVSLTRRLPPRQPAVMPPGPCCPTWPRPSPNHQFQQSQTTGSLQVPRGPQAEFFRGVGLRSGYALPSAHAPESFSS